MSRTVTYVCAACLVLCTLLAFSSAAEETRSPEVTRTYLFKSDRDYPPFEYEEEGQAVGFSVELLRAVARIMQLNIEIAPASWTQTRRELESGLVDGVTTMIFSEARQDHALFTIAHNTVSHALFVRANSSATSLDDMAGRVVMVHAGDIMHDYLIENSRGVTVSPQRNMVTILRKLAGGEADGALMQRAHGLYMICKLGLRNIKEVQIGLAPHQLCFAVSKNNEWLLEQLNEGLHILKATGEYAELRHRWLRQYEPPLHEEYLWYLLAIAGALALVFLVVGVWILLLRRQVRRAVREVRESQRKYKSLFEGANETLFIIDDHIMDCNERALELFGLPRHALIGHSPGEFSPALQPDGRDSVRTAGEYWRAAIAGTPQFFPWTHQRANGDLFDAEVSLRPIEIAGRVLGLASVRDVSEREDRRRRIQRQQTALLQVARDKSLAEGNLEAAATLIVTLATEVLHIDRAGFWKIDGKYLECIAFHDRHNASDERPRLVALDAVPTYLAALKNSRFLDAADARTDPRTMELRDRYLDSEIVAAMLDTSIWLGGELVGVLCHEQYTNPREWLSEEVQFASEMADQAAQALASAERRAAETERRSLEAQVQHAQKLESLGVLAGGIAHDFNNLLMAIIGNVELALMDVGSDNPARNPIREIEVVARRAADLCRQMLAYSGKGKFLVEAIDLNALVREMGHMLDVSVSKSAVMRFRLTEPLPAINADASQLRQVLMNLVLNASEAIGESNGEITIRTDVTRRNAQHVNNLYLDESLSEGVYIVLEVSDTGHGMDQDTCARIFDPFFSTKFAGRGLGLAAALGIIRSHKGAVEVHSEPGRDTTFTVFLPATDQEIAPQPQETNGAAHWRGSGVVLLVDDEESLLTVAAKILRRLGFEVLVARDGVQALEVFTRHADVVRCVILDLTMPNMNGADCFRELRRLCPDVRVLLSSGFTEQDAIQRFGDTDRASFIQKPYRLATLIEKLREVLGE